MTNGTANARLLLRLAFPAEAHVRFGAPAEAWVAIVIPVISSDGTDIPLQFSVQVPALCHVACVCRRYRTIRSRHLSRIIARCLLVSACS